MGQWAYSFDAVDNLISQTDARGIITEFVYDALNRETHRWYPASWTEGTLVAGSSRPTIHDLIEIQSAIDTAYAARGWTNFGGWTDDAPEAGVTRVRFVHFNEVKDRLSQLRYAAGLGYLSSPNGDFPLTAAKPIRAAHLTQLRDWLTSYEAAALPGPSFEAEEGATPAEQAALRHALAVWARGMPPVQTKEEVALPAELRASLRAHGYWDAK